MRGRGFSDGRDGRDRRGGYFSERGSSHRGRGGGDAGRQRDTLPKLSIFERKKLQQETAIENLSSSKLTYGGSDQLVLIVNGELITTVWKKKLLKTPWHQNDVRIFISSALVTADSQEAGGLVSELGNPEGGLKRLEEIINFPMSCDAGLNNRILSFQYVILPLLGLFTRTAITKCILEKYVDAIFMLIYKNLVSIIELIKLNVIYYSFFFTIDFHFFPKNQDSFLYKKVMKMLETLVQRNSIEDRNVSVDGLFKDEQYSFIPPS
jgi:hypothetical protein